VQRSLYAFAEAHVGPIARVVAMSRDRGERVTTARVWKLETDAGAFALKQAGPGRAFAQECAALVVSAPLVDRVPRLVARDPATRTLLTTWLPGRPGDAVLGDAERIAMFTAAGALRRTIAALPVVDDDPVPLERAIAARMQAAIAAAHDVLAPGVVARVRAAWRPEPFAGTQRRFCHRDFAPYNWLVDGDPSAPCVRVVDFGHARADHPLVDVARACAPPYDDPRLRAAFVGPLDVDEREQLRQLELLEALVAATWGRTRGDAAIRARGDAALAAWFR